MPTAIRIGTAAIATLALKAARPEGRKFTAAFDSHAGSHAEPKSAGHTAVVESEDAASPAWYRHPHSHRESVRWRHLTVTAIGIAAVAVAGTRIRHAAGSGKCTVLGHRRNAEPVTLERISSPEPVSVI